MSRRFAPRRGVSSSPGQELLGVITSHGPSRKSYQACREAGMWPAAAAASVPAADTPVSAERVRAALPSPAGVPALLQRRLPEGGAAMVALEGAATIPGDAGGQAETEPPEPVLPGALQKAENTRARGSYRGREGNHYGTFFSTILVTGRAATKDSCGRGEVPYNASVPMPAGVRWSASKIGSGGGKKRAI